VDQSFVVIAHAKPPSGYASPPNHFRTFASLRLSVGVEGLCRWRGCSLATHSGPASYGEDPHEQIFEDRGKRTDSI